MTLEVKTNGPQMGAAKVIVAAVAADNVETAAKFRVLEMQLAELGSLMVAYSGGVDSAFLAATAYRVLGTRMLAVLADSPSLARRDLEQARRLHDHWGCRCG